MIRLAFAALVALTGTMAVAADTPLMTWSDLTGRERPHPDSALTYGTDPYQVVDLWLPAGRGLHPTVVMVHGGCWTTSIADRTLMNWIAADLRASGVAVWNIDYRGVDRPGGGYPGTFGDVAAAADALIANAQRYHLDTRRIVAVGHSAGGHLALWLAARHRLPVGSPLRGTHPLAIHQVVSLGGLPDLEATAASPDNGCGTEVIGRLVGAATPAHPDPYADTSIPRLLPLGVRQDLVNGREDRIIPLRLGTAYEAQARRAGDRVVLHVVDQTGHVELITPDSAAWTQAKRLILSALRS